MTFQKDEGTDVSRANHRGRNGRSQGAARPDRRGVGLLLAFAPARAVGGERRVGLTALHSSSTRPRWYSIMDEPAGCAGAGSQRGWRRPGFALLCPLPAWYRCATM